MKNYDALISEKNMMIQKDKRAYESTLKLMQNDYEKRVKQLEYEIAVLKHEQMLEAKIMNTVHMEKVKAYLAGVAEHTYTRSDRRFMKIIPFSVNEDFFYAVISWNPELNANIDISVRYIDLLLVSSTTPNEIKHTIFDKTFTHTSKATSDEDKERFVYIAEILSKHWNKDLITTSKVINATVLMNWIKSFFEERVIKMHKVKTATKRFGI